MILSTTTHGDGANRVGPIHGGSADHGLFADLTERLVTAGCAVTTVDLRGHGLSDRASSYSLQELAGDVVESLPMGLDVVMGHSLGALVLLEAAAALAPDGPCTSTRPSCRSLGRHPDGTVMSAAELLAQNPT